MLPLFDYPRSHDATYALETHNMPQSGLSHKKLRAYCGEDGRGSSKWPATRKKTRHWHP